MKIQIVSRYLNLASEGLVPGIECPLDQALLMCNQDLDDKIYLYCLSCDYKNYIGLNFYNNLLNQIKLLK